MLVVEQLQAAAEQGGIKIGEQGKKCIFNASTLAKPNANSNNSGL